MRRSQHLGRSGANPARGGASAIKQSAVEQGNGNMSADNGVYVLYTEAAKGSEYRVAYAHAIDNIFGTFSEETNSWTGDNTAIVNTFGQSKVFYNLAEALDYAEDLSKEFEYLEDDVSIISDFQDRAHLFDLGGEDYGESGC